MVPSEQKRSASYRDTSPMGHSIEKYDSHVNVFYDNRRSGHECCICKKVCISLVDFISATCIIEGGNGA